VPLIIWGPGTGVREGEINGTPVGSVDLMPTLLEAIGAPVPPHLPGESVLDTCTGEGRTRERALLASLASWRSLYDGRYLYAIQGEADCWRPLALIDTEADPYDLNDLLDAPGHVATRERMHARLVDELIRTSDHEFVLRTHLKERHV
jgi:arylsulfatase A-like enzyme